MAARRRDIAAARMKALAAVIVVAVIVVGLLLTLRSSRRTGMPSEDVIKRADERTRAQDAAERDR